MIERDIRRRNAQIRLILRHLHRRPFYGRSRYNPAREEIAVTPDLRKRGIWRVTWAIDGEACGHVELRSFEEAVRTAVKEYDLDPATIVVDPAAPQRDPARQGPVRPIRIPVVRIFGWLPKVDKTIVDVNEGRRSYSTSFPVTVSRLDARRGYYLLDGYHRVVEAVLRDDRAIAALIDPHLPRIERTGGAHRRHLEEMVPIADYVRNQLHLRTLEPGV